MNLSEKKRIALLTFGNDLFQSEVMIKCLTAEAARFGFDLLVVNGGRYQVSQGMEYMHNTLYSYLHEGLIDGLIINKIFEYDDFEERAAHLPNWESLPKVSLANPMKNIPSVLIDNRTGFSDLMDHLILEQGCEKFGLVVPRLETSLRDFTERESIFYEKLRENNIEIDDECVFRGRYDYEGGKKVVVDQILKDRHDIQALVCLNDELALGAIREIQKRGKQVPYDIKVTGFDNSAESSFIYPSLTTVTYPFTQIAERGMELMYSLINNKPVPKETYVPTYFIPRLSSGYSLTETVHSKYYRFDIENSRTEGYTIEAALESFRSGNLSDVAAFHLKNSNLYMSDEQL
ncbi:MAG: LacI family DNA-binding transcriptional regulator, partial [Spirochaetia bacterium]